LGKNVSCFGMQVCHDGHNVAEFVLLPALPLVVMVSFQITQSWFPGIGIVLMMPVFRIH
jgi:hypothetical protein